MALRFLSDGRLKLDDGRSLDRGPDWLTRAAATRLAQTADLIIYRSYPQSEDVARDARRVKALLDRVDSHASDVGARRYSGSGSTVLTLEESH